MGHDDRSYLLAGQPTELERLSVQARVWEPSGRALLSQLPNGSGRRAVDIGCGLMGWLRVLSEWVGIGGTVVGTDVDDAMLAGARTFVEEASLGNITLMKDDLFASQLAKRSFDLVHSRFEIAPLGRGEEQIAIYRGLVKPGGWIVIEDPDIGSWRVNPEAPTVQRLIELITEAFTMAGGNLNAGRKDPSLFRAAGLEPSVNAYVIALPPGHPYLRLPLQFATSLRPRLEKLIGVAALEGVLKEAEAELDRAGTWGTTFTLIQSFAKVPD
jgi:SAM-dependent methyltransferase